MSIGRIREDDELIQKLLNKIEEKGERYVEPQRDMLRGRLISDIQMLLIQWDQDKSERHNNAVSKKNKKFFRDHVEQVVYDHTADTREQRYIFVSLLRSLIDLECTPAVEALRKHILEVEEGIPKGVSLDWGNAPR
jgi:hypothetical protein